VTRRPGAAPSRCERQADASTSTLRMKNQGLGCRLVPQNTRSASHAPRRATSCREGRARWTRDDTRVTFVSSLRSVSSAQRRRHDERPCTGASRAPLRIEPATEGRRVRRPSCTTYHRMPLCPGPNVRHIRSVQFVHAALPSLIVKGIVSAGDVPVAGTRRRSLRSCMRDDTVAGGSGIRVYSVVETLTMSPSSSTA
jgi:hypothetical protein